MHSAPPVRSRRAEHDGVDPVRSRVLGGMALAYGCLAVLFFLGWWIYTGPEVVTCPVVNQSCYVPLTQRTVPIFDPLEIAPLAIGMLYPLVPILDPRRAYRWLGVLAASAVAGFTAYRVFLPAPRVAADAGGFILPVPSLYAAAATAFLVLAAAVVVRGLFPGRERSARLHLRPKTPAEVLTDILRENEASERQRGAGEER